MLLRDVSMRGTQSQDRVVATDTDRKTAAADSSCAATGGRRGALLLLVAIVWSVERLAVLRDRPSRATACVPAAVERGAFVRDVAATGMVVAAVSPTLFAEAPGIVIYKVRAGDTVKPGDVLGEVESAALTNEYERERATLTSVEADLNRQTIEVRRTDPQERPGQRSGQGADHRGGTRVQARRGSLGHPRDPGARLQARPGRSRDRQAELRACRADRRPGEGQPGTGTACAARHARRAGAARWRAYASAWMR